MIAQPNCAQNTSDSNTFVTSKVALIDEFNNILSCYETLMLLSTESEISFQYSYHILETINQRLETAIANLKQSSI